MEKRISLKEELIEKIFNYLITKPYAEVAPIIQLIQQDLQDNNKVEGEVEKEKE